MAILIDPPRWPAHGTVFSHLISDESLDELHGFAAAAGLPERAFDHDHYDVPQRRYAELVALGAHEVSGRELVQRLRSSGLRVPARYRSDRLDTALLTHWRTLFPRGETSFPSGRVSDRAGAVREQLGRDLTARWGETHRHHHNRTHLLAVLEAVDLLLTADGNSPHLGQARSVKLAAWFHDAVYQRQPGRDEEESARLAEDQLPAAGCSARETAEVARLVRITSDHLPAPEDSAGAILCDADLSVLGGSPAAYNTYVAAVRLEYAHIPDDAFTAGRSAVLERLMSLHPIFRTLPGRRLWEQSARENLAREHHILTRLAPHWTGRRAKRPDAFSTALPFTGTPVQPHNP